MGCLRREQREKGRPAGQARDAAVKFPRATSGRSTEHSIQIPAPSMDRPRDTTDSGVSVSSRRAVPLPRHSRPGLGYHRRRTFLNAQYRTRHHHRRLLITLAATRHATWAHSNWKRCSGPHVPKGEPSCELCVLPLFRNIKRFGKLACLTKTSYILPAKKTYILERR